MRFFGCMIMLVGIAVFGCSTAEAPKDRPLGDVLAQPVPIEVDGRPLIREDGGPLPCVGDIDGDGRLDLLLGVGHEGRLLVYRNLAPSGPPRLSSPVWFDEATPSGKIPKG